MNAFNPLPGHSRDRLQCDEEGGWVYRQSGFDPAQRAHAETLFALANGTLGVRGGFEEDASASDGTYLSAVYEQAPIHYHERLAGFARNTDTRIPVAEGKGIQVWLGDERITLDTAVLQSFGRSIDLRSGVLTRQVQLRSASGHTIRIDAERVLPLAETGLLAIRFNITSVDYNGPLTLVSTLDGQRSAVSQGDDPRIGAGRALGIQTVASHADREWAWLHQRTRHGSIALTCAQRHVVHPGLQAGAHRSTALHVEQDFSAHLQAGQTVTLEKFVLYAHEAHARAEDALRQALARAANTGFAAFATAQADTLAAFWQRADISVQAQSGDQTDVLALRFNLFHLLQSAGRNGVDGTAAKGMTGEGYEGHCFWDTEAFVLPVMVFTAPDVARAMLMFRHRTLDAARAHAREMNHACGALYPWRTINGGECSAHYPSGSAAYHINAAIAHAIGLYMDASGDEEFLRDAGAEMLFESARIWLQIGHFDPRRDGAFCIHEVTGPDEYTAMVDNNFYTNRMAQQHLLRAVDAWHRLHRYFPQQAQALAARLQLDGEEIACWQRAAQAMYLPQDDVLGIYAQDDSFLYKPHWPLPLRQRAHRPLLLDQHPLTLYRHQVCKQADAVMALMLAGHDLDPAMQRRTFDYYEAITTHDSTLSAPVFGVVASAVGQPHKAWQYFDASLRVDLDNLHGNTDHGVHMAAMAGSWLGLAMGFAGMRVHDGALHFAPHCPQAWDSFGFNLQWQGRHLRVEADPQQARYRLLAGPPLTITHAGQRLHLVAGQPSAVAVTHAAAHAAFPRPCQALIFDLDGVLTDTASSHYRAWKRMADEEQIPFDIQINERLKGVDRMHSLEIILERSARTYTTVQKLQLAERKNGYYVEELAGMGPTDLFPGVEQLLQQARIAGLKLGLASASRNAGTLLARLGIADRFDYIADAARIGSAKPDPEIFLTVAHALQVPPALCIGVEDAAAGIQAIHAAGMAAIGIGSPAALGAADMVLPDIASLRLADVVAAGDSGASHGCTRVPNLPAGVAEPASRADP